MKILSTANNTIPNTYTAPITHISDKNILVCLDSGHGESTPGKRSPDNSIFEWSYNREIVRRIKSKIDALGFADVFLTVEDNSDLKLSKRAQLANQAASSYLHSLFISVHVNAATDFSKWQEYATGWSCYTTKGQNNSDILGECLYDAAEKLLEPMGIKIRTYMNQELQKDFEENFTVIYMADMPAVLTENLFMDNKKDVEFLLSEKGKDTIAELHVKGIQEFIKRMNW